MCNSCGTGTLTLGTFSVASYWLVSQTRRLQQSDLLPLPPPLGKLVVTVTPQPLPIDEATAFTVTTTDAASGVAVAGATVLIHNFTARPSGAPVALQLAETGSPIRATATFHAGRSVDPITHETTFDKSPTFAVSAPGYETLLVSPSFAMPEL